MKKTLFTIMDENYLGRHQVRKGLKELRELEQKISKTKKIMSGIWVMAAAPYAYSLIQDGSLTPNHANLAYSFLKISLVNYALLSLPLLGRDYFKLEKEKAQKLERLVGSA